jgi:hypothetical protein
MIFLGYSENREKKLNSRHTFNKTQERKKVKVLNNIVEINYFTVKLSLFVTR